MHKKNVKKRCRVSNSGHISAYLRVVSHDVIKACQQAQAGTDLYVHGSVHVVEEVKSLVDQLAAFLQETWIFFLFKSNVQTFLFQNVTQSLVINASHLAAPLPAHSGRSGRHRRLWGSRASQQGKYSRCPPL